MGTLWDKMVLVAIVLAAGSCSSSGAEVKAVAVSGRSPFRSCSFQAPIHNPNSRMILDSEVEPSLGISPKDPKVSSVFTKRTGGRAVRPEGSWPASRTTAADGGGRFLYP